VESRRREEGTPPAWAAVEGVPDAALEPGAGGAPVAGAELRGALALPGGWSAGLLVCWSAGLLVWNTAAGSSPHPRVQALREPPSDER